MTRCHDGMGFLHAAQLFPLDEVHLWLPGPGEDHTAASGVAYSIVRCRRLGNACYECGARLTDDADREAVDAVLKRLIWETGG